MSRRADGRKVAEWRGRFERCRRSGLSVGRFCVAEKVSVPSFYQWRKKLAARSVAAIPRSSAGISRSSAGISRSAAGIARSAGAEAAESFARVRLVGAATVAAWLPGGTRLEIPLGDARVMQLAIEALVRADASHLQGSSHTLDSLAVARAGGATC